MLILSDKWITTKCIGGDTLCIGGDTLYVSEVTLYMYRR